MIHCSCRHVTLEQESEYSACKTQRLYLLFGLAVLSLPRLLLDMCDHSKGGSVVAVGQVDDIGYGWKDGPLAAGTNGSALLTHSQEELERVIEKKTDLKHLGWAQMVKSQSSQQVCTQKQSARCYSAPRLDRANFPSLAPVPLVL